MLSGGKRGEEADATPAKVQKVAKSPVSTIDDLKLSSARATLDAHPTRGYVSAETPIEPMPRLTAELGGEVELFVKRDDLLPLAGGGSKTRKLDYLVQQAIDAKHDTIVTCGAVQSNHCRLTASAAAREGLECHLVLEERVLGSYDPSAGGNNYAFALLGAHTSVVPLGGVDAAVAALLERLRADGKSPFFIPGGGSNAVGALGYAQAALSIVEHARADRRPFDAIVLCSGSGGTHSGMLAGLRACGDTTPVYGISVRFDAAKQKARIEEQYTACAALFGNAAPATDVLIDDRHVGPGYSLPTDGMREAVGLFARREGILLDPVYTGKGAAGLLALVRDGTLKPGQRVLFLHTGGAPSLYHYQPLEAERA